MITPPPPGAQPAEKRWRCARDGLPLQRRIWRGSGISSGCTWSKSIPVKKHLRAWRLCASIDDASCPIRSSAIRRLPPGREYCPKRRPSNRNAANDLHRALGHRPEGNAHLLAFGEDEREYALTVRFAGCHQYTHGNDGNSRGQRSMLHLALSNGCITAYSED